VDLEGILFLVLGPVLAPRALSEAEGDDLGEKPPAAVGALEDAYCAPIALVIRTSGYDRHGEAQYTLRMAVIDISSFVRLRFLPRIRMRVGLQLDC
jgi:hypothetical protein